MTDRYDAVVVGAGPAGAAYSILLARRGHSVLLLDKARFPRDKPCGEGILPHGVAVLAELGLEPRLLAAGALPFWGLRYWTPDGTNAEARFPDLPGPGHGLVLRRLELDRVLLEAARSEPGVAVIEEARVTGLLRGELPGGEPCVAGVTAELGPRRRRTQVRSRLTVGADGLHSRVRGWLGLERPAHGPRRWGIRAHLHGVSELSEYVEVALDEQGEVYLARCGPEDALVALLLDSEAMRDFRGRPTEAFLGHVHRCRALRGRLAAAGPPRDVLATGPLGSAEVDPIAHGALLVGDSAGALDPITAEGIALALRGARLAAEFSANALENGDVSRRGLAGYARAIARERHDLARLTALVLRLCRHRHFASRAVHVLKRRPELLQRLLGVSVGAYPYRSLRARDKLRLLLGW
jgi:flavin-dependent dehydrogenase